MEQKGGGMAYGFRQKSSRNCGGTLNFGEEIRQNGGAIFRVLKGKIRRRCCDIYRRISVARGQSNLSEIDRKNWNISRPVQTRRRTRL
jgi:hypothetical protein